MSVEIRNYTPRDLAAIEKIHEANGIDYQLPNLSRFPVNKVVSLDGEVKASYGLQHTLEGHLWLDPSDWTDAEGKWAAIQTLDKTATEDAASLGVESIFVCVPPGYERFGRRLNSLSFTKIRPEWAVYTKRTQEKKQ